MTQEHIAITYEQALNDLNRFNRAVIETMREWSADPTLSARLGDMLEELRLRTLIVNAAKAMSTEASLTTTAA